MKKKSTEKKITQNTSKRISTLNKNKKSLKNKSSLHDINKIKTPLKKPEFPEAIVTGILEKIISYVVRQSSVKEVYTHMGTKCFSYLIYLIQPYLCTEYINYENGLDDIEFQNKKICYKSIMHQKVNTWAFFPEPNTPGIDRYSPAASKLISLPSNNNNANNINNNEAIIHLNEKEKKEKESIKRKSLIDINSIVNESVEFINIESSKNVKININKIIQKKSKEKKDKDIIVEKLEKTEKNERFGDKDKIIDLTCEDLEKEKYENQYRAINENEENNELRKEREYLIKKKLELKAIQDIQEKKDKLKRFQNRLQKNFDGSKQTFDPDGKIILIHQPVVDNLINEFNFVKIPYIHNKNPSIANSKKRKTTVFNPKAQLSRLSNNNFNPNTTFTKEDDLSQKMNAIPPDFRQIFEYIRDVLVPKWQKKPFMKNNYSSSSRNKNQNNNNKVNYISKNKSFKLFFGPFLRKYVFKGNIIHNPLDAYKNNAYLRFDNSKRKNLAAPSGSNFKIIKPEVGVVIEEKNARKKKEIKDGGFEYIKKYNKPSMYEFSKLVMESSNLNSMNSGMFSSGLIESKVNEINEIKNRKKNNELNKDDYNGYMFEFSDNANPLFQDALSINNNENNNNENNVDNADNKENNDKKNYENKNIFRAMEEGYLKSKYNSMNLISLQKRIHLNNKIPNLYSYFGENVDNINYNKNSKRTIINNAPLPVIKVHRVNENKSEIKEMRNKIKGRKIINKFNFKILKDKKWGEEDKKNENITSSNNNDNVISVDNNNINKLKRVAKNIINSENNNPRIKKKLIKSASTGRIF